MSNFSTKLNLTGLKHVVRKMKGKDGHEVDVLILPIAANNLYAGKEGAFYLDLSHFELKDGPSKYGDTHLVKQNLPKEIRDTMSEDEIRAMPILGNSRPFGVGTSAQSAVYDDGGEDDDLPF